MQVVYNFKKLLDFLFIYISLKFFETFDHFFYTTKKAEVFLEIAIITRDFFGLCMIILYMLSLKMKSTIYIVINYKWRH